MKQFTTPPIRIRFPNIDATEITQADFVIKEKIVRDAYPLVKARYTKEPIEPVEGIITVTLEDDVFSFVIPADVTSQMPVDESGRPSILWLDSRVKIGDTVLDTPIQKIRIKPTLFSEDYEEEGGEW